MSFIKGLSNFLAGKPVFEDNGQAPSVNQSPQQPQNQPQQTGGPKLTPEVVVERFEYNERGDEFTLNLHIKNRSSVEIFIDKIIVLGNKKEVDYFLRPGEMREFTDFYKGKKLTHQNYKNCELYYHNEGDNFMTNNRIEYQSKGNGIYDIKGIRFIPPVKDLYGNN